MNTLAQRMLPPVTDANRSFLTGGSRGELLIQRCGSCRRWVHPPVRQAGGCTACGGDLAPEPVSGLGTVFTYTVNHQRFHPNVEPPYVIALVELDEQAHLRIPTNIVNCDPESITVGMKVRVVFEPNGDPVGSVHIALFEPA